MQHLVIDINLAHFRLHALSHFLFESLLSVFSGRFLPELANASLLNKIWKLERNLVDASLVLQITAFLGPMAWHWNRIPYLLALKKE